MGGGGKMRRMMHTPDLDEPPLPRAPTCPHSFSFYLFPASPSIAVTARTVKPDSRKLR